MRIHQVIVSIILMGGSVAVSDAAEVSRSLSTEAKAADVWQQIGPFCAIADWYPGIETCEEETIGGEVHRRLTTADGAVFLEKMLAYDDAAMSYSYAIVEGPLPVAEYRAVFSVEDADAGSEVTWQGTFNAAGASEQEAQGIVAGIYETGLEAVRQRFAN